MRRDAVLAQRLKQANPIDRTGCTAYADNQRMLHLLWFRPPFFAWRPQGPSFGKAGLSERQRVAACGFDFSYRRLRLSEFAAGAGLV